MIKSGSASKDANPNVNHIDPLSHDGRVAGKD